MVSFFFSGMFKSVRIYITVLFILFSTFLAEVQSAGFTIVLDAGHGGHDAGAVGAISREKDINLGVVKALGNMIDQNFSDVKVVYTRKTDVFIPLQERADIANRNKADLFISVHTNAAKSRAAYGAEVYTLGLAKSKANLDVAMTENAVMLLEDDYQTKYKGFDPNSVESYIMFEFMQDKYLDKSLEFATRVQDNFVNGVKRYDRGVRQAGFWVLHRSACPSVLVELGFISNRNEELFLASETGQRKLAQAIYNAFVKYKRDFDKKQGIASGTKSQAREIPMEELSSDSIEKESNNSKTDKQEDKKELSKTDESSVKDIKGTKTNDVVVDKSDAKVIPVYKVQFLVHPTQLKSGAAKLKGLKEFDFYQEAGQYKYTTGSTTVYQDILKTKKEISAKFPDAFVISFLGDKKIPLNEARKMK